MLTVPLPEGARPPGPPTGWHLLAFTAELDGDVAPVTVAGHPLVLVRDGGSVRVGDATCPHRGANLGYGGTLVGEGLVRCPFHGRLVALGEVSRPGYRVREYPTLVAGGAVFVLFDEGHENGLHTLLDSFLVTHTVVPGFVLPARVEPEYVIENVFDAEHFQAVHKVADQPQLTVADGAGGELVVRGELHNRRPNLWQAGGSDGQSVVTQVIAHVLSPTLVLTELATGADRYAVVTGASPTATGCVIRVAAIVPAGPDGDPADPVAARGLLRDSHTAFEQDMAVWEHLTPGAPQHFDERDEAVLTFRRFCERFAASSPDVQDGGPGTGGARGRAGPSMTNGRS